MSFPEQPFGFVAGRWVLSIGDTPDDPDRAPDYVPVKDGAIVFTPQVTHRVAADGAGWAGIIKDRVLGGVGERGQLIDAEGHDHLALAVGVYSVSYDFGPGMSWPSHYIEVKQEHTADAPLWLPPIAPPAKGPMIENRVVTIPADGEDGQVLVWDGAGFSWMDVPEGPEGPPGEVTTAALTSALAGKVTGQGMTLRHDNSVGTRVFLDHPGGSTMLYGDTGWRNISSLLTWGTGTVWIKRENGIVSMIWQSVRKGDGSPAAFLTLPTGFRPTVWVSNVPISDRDNTTSRNELDIAGDGVVTPAAMSSLSAGRLQANLSWSTNRDWPTTLPGTPA